MSDGSIVASVLGMVWLFSPFVTVLVFGENSNAFYANVCVSYGWLGVHRFMKDGGKLGLAYFFSLGGFGVGWVADSVAAIKKAIEDPRGRYKESETTTNRNKLQKIVDGEIVIRPIGVILHPGEKCYFSQNVSVITTKRETIGYSGGGAGVSVRVAKGVRVHTGRSASTAVKGNVEIANSGVLTVTDKRIVLSSEKGSFDNKISQLSSFVPSQNDVSLQFGSKHYVIRSKSAGMLRAAIEQAVSQM